jgi:hypothetical protein
MELGRWLRVEWDRAAAIACVVLAALLLVIGWFRMSSTPYPAEQLPFILSGGIGGVFLLGIGATLWLSADLRDEWRKLDSIDEVLHELADSPLVDEQALGNSNGNGQAPTTAAKKTTKPSSKRPAKKAAKAQS